MIAGEKDTKDRIQQKADELFMRYGIRSVSMDDIANTLGISKKTIYQYFADKDELVDAVVEAILHENESGCELDRSNAENAVDEIFKTMEMLEEMMANMNPSVVFDMQKYHPRAFSKFLKHKNQYLFRVIKENIERGIKEELYRPELNVDIMTRFRLEAMMMAFNPDFFAKHKHPLVEVQQALIEHYLFGLASLKGHKLILKYKQERTKNAIKHETVNKGR